MNELYEQIHREQLKKIIYDIFKEGIYTGIINDYYMADDICQREFEEAITRVFNRLKNEQTKL